MVDAAIDSLRDADGRLDRTALRAILPYGDDFLFVDEVTQLTDEQVAASFTIPVEAPFIRAHFEGLPIMPGVLVGEGMAQAGTVMVRYNLEDHKSHDLLAFLMHYPGRAWTRGQLLTRVWGAQYDGDDRTVDLHVARLRSAIEENPRDPEWIETVWRVGYRFREEAP